MIIQPPYQYDFEQILTLDPADRWIYDKLDLSTRLGHNCGPHDVIPPPGVYCVRPIESLHGMGTGGFFKVDTDDWLQEPGYFWCEWFDGPHRWIQYINDVAVSNSTGVMNNADTLECEQTPTNTAPALDPVLQNFSRYLLVEMIGDKIIEAAPRFMSYNAQQRFIANYRQIEPQYRGDELVSDIRFGTTDMKRHPITLNGHDGYTWGDYRSDSLDINRRPHTIHT